MSAVIGDWIRDIRSLGERRRFFRESASRLSLYYYDFAVRNKNAPTELDGEFRDVISAAEILLSRKKWNHLIEIANALSGFMEERGYWDESLWLHSAALDGIERKFANFFKQPTPTDWHLRIFFLTRLASIQTRQGYFQDAEQYFTEALKTAERIKQTKIQAQINNFLSTLARLQGRHEEAQEYLKRSQMLVPDLELQGQLSGKYLDVLSRGNLVEAKQIAMTKREKAQQGNDKSLEADALCNLGDIAMREGSTGEALGAYNQAIAIYAGNSDREGEMDAWRSLAKVHADLGDTDEAQHILENVMEYYAQKGSMANILEVYIDQGGYLIDELKFEEAETCFQKGMEIAIQLQSLPQLAICFYQMGIIQERKGDLDQAIQQYTQFLKAADESQHQQLIGIACFCLGMALIQNDDLENARQYLIRRLDICLAMNSKSDEASTLHLLGDVDTKLGAYENANAILEKAAGIYSEIGNPIDIGQVKYSQSRLFFEQRLYQRSWDYLSQMILLINTSNRDALASLAVAMLDRFANIPEFQEQVPRLLKTLALAREDSDQ